MKGTGEPVSGALSIVASEAAPARAMGHLRVVSSPSFSPIPHEILLDKAISRDARLLYGVLQMHWWQSGICYASHATLADELGVSTRTLREYLIELMARGHIVEAPCGWGRAKAYLPSSIGRRIHLPDGTNRKQSAGQSEAELRSNRKPASDPMKKTPEKKTPEEDPLPTGEGRSRAAPHPGGKPKRRNTVKPPPTDETFAPEAIELSDVSYATAERWGFDRAAVDFQLELFLSKARAEGWTYADWKAGFRTWLLKEVGFAKRDGRPVGAAVASGRSGRQDPGPAKPLVPNSESALPATVRSYQINAD